MNQLSTMQSKDIVETGMAADEKAGKVKTVQGSELTVITTDTVADNGVIHVTDSVILPK